jgi:hypothetical protein
VRKGALLGFVKVQMPSEMVLNECSILTGDRGPWASPPSRPQLGRDGLVVKDVNGKTRYVPLVEFASREARDRWSDAVIAALRASHPDALS